MSAMDLTLLYKETVAALAIDLQLLDAGMLQPEACCARIKQSFDRCASCVACPQEGGLL